MEVATSIVQITVVAIAVVHAQIHAQEEVSTNHSRQLGVLLDYLLRFL